MPIAVERRNWPRTTPGALGDHLLMLDMTHKRMTPAKLLDIGAGGALIRSDDVIAGGGHLSLLVRDLPELGWIDAEVVRGRGPGEIGLRFVSPFRPEFILEATRDRGRERDECASMQTPYLGDAIPIW